jgi:hypothetical protein
MIAPLFTDELKGQLVTGSRSCVLKGRPAGSTPIHWSR